MEIFKLLRAYNYYGETETIEIAKGKYKIPETWRFGFTQLKRYFKYITRIKN
tara:strand:+ start:6555 stop:6710 length:156 start_codon:yes stop_codon:yes gene_type:complete